MTAIVAVIADVRVDAGYTWHAAAETYLRALRDVAGVTPVIVPSLPALQADDLLGRVDGLLATGARSNVHPSRYGEQETDEHGPFDPARDDASLGLMRRAVELGVPVLALCRGFQEMNVAWGGSLTPALHEVPGRADHRAQTSTVQDERFALRHDITPTPDGALSGIVGDEPVRVNSLHRQGIVGLGEGLAIEALAPDGTIEAMSVVDARAFALGVQWHPEYWAETDPASRAIFEAFGDAVRARAEGLGLA